MIATASTSSVIPGPVLFLAASLLAGAFPGGDDEPLPAPLVPAGTVVSPRAVAIPVSLI